MLTVACSGAAAGGGGGSWGGAGGGAGGGAPHTLGQRQVYTQHQPSPGPRQTSNGTKRLDIFCIYIFKTENIFR